MEALTDAELQEKIRDMEAEMRRNRQTMTTINAENRRLDQRIEENQKRLKQSTQLPFLVATIGELLDIEEEPEEGQEGSGFAVKKTEQQMQKKKAVILKTTARQTIYLPVLGMVEPEDVKIGEMVAV